MDLQGEGTHQSLIRCALESRPTFFLQVLSPHWDPRAFHPRSLCLSEERKLVFSFMVHVYFWCVAGIVMFPMAGPGDLSRMMVHLRETVLMMHWPWLQAPSVLNKHTHAHRHNARHAIHIHTPHLKIPSPRPSQVITGETTDASFLGTKCCQMRGLRNVVQQKHINRYLRYFTKIWSNLQIQYLWFWDYWLAKQAIWRRALGL